MDDLVKHKLPPKICQACLKFENENGFHEIKETMRYFTHFLNIEMDTLSLHWLCSVCHQVVCDNLIFADSVRQANQQLSTILKSYHSSKVSTGEKDSARYDSNELAVGSEQNYFKNETDDFTDVIDDVPDNDGDDYAESKFDFSNPTQDAPNVANEGETNGAHLSDRCCREEQVTDGPSTEQRTSDGELTKRSIARRRDSAIQHGRRRANGKRRSAKSRTEPATSESAADGDNVVTIFLGDGDRAEAFRRKAASKAYRDRVYKCELCLTGFSYKEPYTMHLQRHSESCGRHVCATCRLRFKSLSKLKQHAYTHSRMYQCARCDYRKFSRNSILNHYERAHRADVNLCNVCGKHYSTSELLKRHKQIHKGAKYECCHCGCFYTSKQTIQYHIRKQHTRPEPGDALERYRCDVCGKAFVFAFGLNVHKLRHSDSREYYCVECDISFKTPYDLRNHLECTLKHANPDSLLPCADCPLKFIQQAALRRHVKLKHSGRKKPFQCERCPKTFYHRSEVKRHLRRTHEGILPERKYVCSQCGKSYMNKNTLMSHQNTHTGERPYVCAICGATFAYKAAHFTHNQLVHLKIKRNCDIKRAKTKKDGSNGEATG